MNELKIAIDIVKIRNLDVRGWSLSVKNYGRLRLFVALLLACFLFFAVIIIDDRLLIHFSSDYAYMAALADIVFLLYSCFMSLWKILFTSYRDLFADHPQKKYFEAIGIPCFYVALSELTSALFYRIISVSVVTATTIIHLLMHMRYLNNSIIAIIALYYVLSLLIPCLAGFLICIRRINYNYVTHIGIIISGLFIGVVSGLIIKYALHPIEYKDTIFQNIRFLKPVVMFLPLISIVICMLILKKTIACLMEPFNYVNKKSVKPYSSKNATYSFWKLIIIEMLHSPEGLRFTRIISGVIFLRFAVRYIDIYEYIGENYIGKLSALFIMAVSFATIMLSETVIKKCGINSTIKYARYYWEQGDSEKRLAFQSLWVQLFISMLCIIPLCFLFSHVGLDNRQVGLIVCGGVLGSSFCDSLITVPNKAYGDNSLLMALLSVISQLIISYITVKFWPVVIIMVLFFGGGSFCLTYRQILRRPLNALI